MYGVDRNALFQLFHVHEVAAERRGDPRAGTRWPGRSGPRPRPRHTSASARSSARTSRTRWRTWGNPARSSCSVAEVVQIRLNRLIIPLRRQLHDLGVQRRVAVVVGRRGRWRDQAENPPEPLLPHRAVHDDRVAVGLGVQSSNASTLAPRRARKCVSSGLRPGQRTTGSPNSNRSSPRIASVTIIVSLTP